MGLSAGKSSSAALPTLSSIHIVGLGWVWGSQTLILGIVTALARRQRHSKPLWAVGFCSFPHIQIPAQVHCALHAGSFISFFVLSVSKAWGWNQMLFIEKVMNVQHKIPFRNCHKRWWLKLREKQFTAGLEKGKMLSAVLSLHPHPWIWEPPTSARLQFQTA